MKSKILLFFTFVSVYGQLEESSSPDLNVGASNTYNTGDSLSPYANWLSATQSYAQNPAEASPDLKASSSYSDSETDPFSAQEANYRRKYRKKGGKNKRKKGAKRRNKYKYKDSSEAYEEYNYDESDEYYYDRDDSYGAPKAPSYSAPSSGYSAPSDSYGAPSYSGGGGDGFNDFLNALAAFLPIGLFLAAIPPNLITVTTKKKRSLNENEIETEHPFMRRIAELGVDKFWSDPECQKQILCQMTQKGSEQNANMVQKSLNFASTMYTMLPILMNLKPENGGVIAEVFSAIQDGNSCDESFYCQ